MLITRGEKPAALGLSSVRRVGDADPVLAQIGPDQPKGPELHNFSLLDLSAISGNAERLSHYLVCAGLVNS